MLRIFSEEAMLLKEKGEAEIRKVQEELNKFLVEEHVENGSDEAKEEDDDSKVKKKNILLNILSKVVAPFVFLINRFKKKSFDEKISSLKSIVIVLLVLTTVFLAYASVEKVAKEAGG